MAQAFAALTASPGARAFYDELRASGIEYNDALRRLANRLVGILRGCLKTRTLYDEATAWGHRENLPQSSVAARHLRPLGCLSRRHGGIGGIKRRLPTTYQGETVLAAISLPLVTAEADRHAPSRPHPGRLAAAANAAPIAVSANRPAPAGGVTACPPSSTAIAANATPSSAARARNRRTQPRAVVYGTPPAPPSGGPRIPAGRHLSGHRADGLGYIQPPGQRERGQQRMAHPAPQPGHEDLPVPARLPDIRWYPARTSAARHTTGSRGVGGNPRSRPAAASASTARGHGHTMATGDTASDPFSRSAQHGRSRPRGCAASGCGDRHHAGLLPGADGTLRSSPTSLTSAVQKQEEISGCRRR